MRPVINLQHIFHVVATNAAFASGGMTHCFCRCGLRMFFSVRPIVLSLARSTMCSSTTASKAAAMSTACGPGGFGTGQCDQFPPPRLVKDARSGRGRRDACDQNRPGKPSSTSCWRVRATVSTLVSRASAIWLSLHPSPASEMSAFSRMRALVSCRAGCLPIRINALRRSRSSSLSVTTAFLHGNPFRGHDASPSLRSYRFGKSPRNQ